MTGTFGKSSIWIWKKKQITDERFKLPYISHSNLSFIESGVGWGSRLVFVWSSTK